MHTRPSSASCRLAPSKSSRLSSCFAIAWRKAQKWLHPVSSGAPRSSKNSVVKDQLWLCHWHPEGFGADSWSRSVVTPRRNHMPPWLRGGENHTLLIYSEQKQGAGRIFATPRRRPSHARVRARGTDIGFSNKPPSCFLFSFLSFFCFFSFFPSFSLLAMSGSFLLVVHNSSAAPAADEIRVQKKRVVSDAPEAWIWGCCFMDFSLVCYLKTLPALAGQGRSKIAKTAAGFGIILGIKGMELLWQTKQKIR